MDRPSPVRIRAAQPRDSRAVRDLCDRIGRGDYVPSVFDDWVRDRRGRLWVALVDGRVVAVAKLTLLGEREAWLHALRVDPRFQRRGVATALVEHRLARAKRLGARVARLDTSEDNVAIHRLMRRYAFRRVERINQWQAGPVAVEPPRYATAADVDALWRLARGRLLHEDYVARSLTRADIVRRIRSRQCYAVGPVARPSALAIAQHQAAAHAGADSSRLRVRLLAGSPQASRELLRALRGVARRLRLRSVVLSPLVAQTGVAQAAGYRPRWPDEMHIFEKRL